MLEKARFVFFAFAATLIAGCGLCNNEVLVQQPSTDRKLTATVFVRNCGATTDYSTIVSVHRSEGSFDKSTDFVFVANGRHSLAAVWQSPRLLRIECPGCSERDIFKQVLRDAGVDITYK
jgi:hypothetical protein